MRFLIGGDYFVVLVQLSLHHHNRFAFSKYILTLPDYKYFEVCTIFLGFATILAESFLAMELCKHHCAEFRYIHNNFMDR